MKARVILTGGNPVRQIDVSMEEYKDFIKEQSELLGIATSLTKFESVNATKSNCNFGVPGGDISIIMPKFHGKTASKAFIDELLKELSKTERRND